MHSALFLFALALPQAAPHPDEVRAAQQAAYDALASVPRETPRPEWHERWALAWSSSKPKVHAGFGKVQLASPTCRFKEQVPAWWSMKTAM